MTNEEKDMVNEDVMDSEQIEETVEETEVLSVEEELRKQLEQKTKEAQENYDSFLRAQADFDNFRRRARLEKEELLKYAGQSLVECLIPTIDNFERALAAIEQQTPEVKQTLNGIEMIYRQLFQSLESAGLNKVVSLGEEFDPKRHEAVMQEETTEHKDNTVIEELLVGYQFKDKVLRPAMVKVAKNS